MRRQRQRCGRSRDEAERGWRRDPDTDERWREGTETETEKNKDIETQRERWSKGRNPDARKRGQGGRKQAVGETHLDTGLEIENQKGIKRQRKKDRGRERRQHVCAPGELSFSESIRLHHLDTE